MREYRKKIIIAILNIAKEIAKSLGIAVLGVFFFIIEVITRCTPLIIMISEDHVFDFIGIEMIKSIGEFIDNIKDYVQEIKEAKGEIKNIKKEQVEKQLEIQAKDLITKKTFNDSILEYIRDLLLKITELPIEEQKIFTSKLKEILADYTSKYIDSLQNTNENSLQKEDPLLIRQRTLETLTTIDLTINERIKIHDKVSAITTEEQELLSLMNSKESPSVEGPTLKKRL